MRASRPEANAEPVAWTAEATDTQPELQGTAGSFAIDIYNHAGSGHVFLDDLAIQRFPYPVEVARPRAASRLALGAVRPNPVGAYATFDLSLATAAGAERACRRIVAR